MKFHNYAVCFCRHQPAGWGVRCLCWSTLKIHKQDTPKQAEGLHLLDGVQSMISTPKTEHKMPFSFKLQKKQTPTNFYRMIKWLKHKKREGSFQSVCEGVKPRLRDAFISFREVCPQYCKDKKAHVTTEKGLFICLCGSMSMQVPIDLACMVYAASV